MSHISFPEEHEEHGEQQNGHGNAQFYSSAFDTSASFQMNPLSSHPPRTPRTSIINNSSSSQYVYGSSVYDSKEQPQEPAVEEEEVELDEGTEQLRQAEARVRREEVWREMFLTSNGRDKAFKLIQYSLRVYLLFHTSLTTSRLLRRPARPPWERELVRRLESTVDGLSFTRKCLLLFNWLSPLTVILAQQASPLTTSRSKPAKPKPFLYTMLNAPPPVLLELVQAVADDVFTLSKLGLLGKKTGERAGRFADWCWLIATLVGLVENGVERQMIGSLQHEVESRVYAESMAAGAASAKSKPASSKRDEKELARLQKQDYWLQVTRAKLAMDLVFVSYDVFRLKRGREPIKTFAGLGAAVLSAAKLYDRHKSTLLKAVSLSI
ncbi:hypothetical protein DFH07DRAFT_964472 [Mycena maculata]|uniref:Peroxisomal biogenesis factor 11 n=1 Tax=Mycena maculata TaxID=230809 RepID=A0AAD7IIM0_9AGAR|nr:hypothetical protein DFH07DRAFT_964472 [Mycena maculata]